MRKSTVTLIASWLYGQEVLGFDNKFLFPTDDDLTFYYMNTIEVEYQSNFTNPTLYTFCKVGDDDPKEKDKNTSAPKNNGTVSVTLDFQKGDECWFNLREDEKTSNLGFNSPHNWKFDADDKNTASNIKINYDDGEGPRNHDVVNFVENIINDINDIDINYHFHYNAFCPRS
ncbi:hypothetical protein SCUP234_00608 [Seiridium cupressi]